MKKLWSSIQLPLLAVIFIGSVNAINSSVYDWDKLQVKKTNSGESRSIISGPTRSLEMFGIRAITLNQGQSAKEYKVENGFDELLIIKEGSAEISINGEARILTEGSVVVACQGNSVKVRNVNNMNTTWFEFRFKPKVQPGKVQQNSVNSPIFREWSEIAFKPSANGGRRDILKQPTSVLKELEMHTTTLNEGLPSHAAHNHPDEEIILVRFGTVEETINGAASKLGPGSLIFLTNDDNHGVTNAGKGKCEYYAIRWLTYSEPTK
jgi:quercetin dioxygenase-like cupin family protein